MRSLVMTMVLAFAVSAPFAQTGFASEKHAKAAAHKHNCKDGECERGKKCKDGECAHKKAKHRKKKCDCEHKEKKADA